uniref:Uncharacterized protein n=1 Tax=Knipowitschia caucasica TaxID=637954 RepID=A0AAV2LNW0_KNICA
MGHASTFRGREPRSRPQPLHAEQEEGARCDLSLDGQTDADLWGEGSSCTACAEASAPLSSGTRAAVGRPDQGRLRSSSSH